MYDRGLGVELNKAKMFAWLLWGEERGNRDNDADVREEHDDMRGFYGMTLTDDIKDVAWALFNEMRAANPGVDGNKPKRRRKSPRRKPPPQPIGEALTSACRHTGNDATLRTLQAPFQTTGRAMVTTPVTGTGVPRW